MEIGGKMRTYRYWMIGILSTYDEMNLSPQTIEFIWQII